MSENAWILVVGALLTALQLLAMFILQLIHKKIALVCSTNAAEHKELQKRLYAHRHDKDTGDVVVPHEAA